MQYNSTMLIAVIVLGVLVLVLLGVVLRRPSADPQNALLLKADMTELNKNVTQLKDGLQKQLSDQLGASNKQLASQSAASIKILQEVTEKLTKLEGTNKNVGDTLRTAATRLQRRRTRQGGEE